MNVNCSKVNKHRDKDSRNDDFSPQLKDYALIRETVNTQLIIKKDRLSAVNAYKVMY